MKTLIAVSTIGNLLLLGTGCAPSHTAVSTKPFHRVIVLGFDGMDPTLVRRWIDRGHLPHLAHLEATGAFVPLASPPPAESPVAWASFATGTNPGKHNVFDFLERSPDTYQAVPALYRTFPYQMAFGMFPKYPLRVLSRRSGTPFWDMAGKAGFRSVVIGVPMTYPVDEIPEGHMLSGFPSPDIRDTSGTYYYWATDVSRYEEAGGRGVIRRLVFENGIATTEILGPRNPLNASKVLSVPVKLQWNVEDHTVTAQISGQSVRMSVGTWTHWIPLKFTASTFLKRYGNIQLRLIEADHEVRIFGTPVNPDPAESTSLPFAFPPEFASTIASAIGPFRTVGWTEFAGAALQDGYVDEGLFLEDVNRAFTERERIIIGAVKKQDWDLLVGVIDTTDRVSHMMWRLTDPKHPSYDARLAQRYGDSIERIYERADALVGRIMSEAPSGTILFIVSDHGFHSFRRAVNLNTWLLREGYLSMDSTAVPSTVSGFRGVDWTKTRAYALGLGQIYVNLRGRERSGSVSSGDEYNRLISEIRAKLVMLRDPKDGSFVFREVYRGDSLYSGPYTDNAPDIVVGFADGYRVGFSDASGGFSSAVVEDNTLKWSGDHCGVAADIASGVLLTNVQIRGGASSVMDVAPTVLRLLGAPLSKNFDGHIIQMTIADTGSGRLYE